MTTRLGTFFRDVRERLRFSRGAVAARMGYGTPGRASVSKGALRVQRAEEGRPIGDQLFEALVAALGVDRDEALACRAQDEQAERVDALFLSVVRP